MVMPAGLQIFDATGELKLDITDRVFRFLTVVVPSGVSGSVAVPELATGTALVATIPGTTDDTKKPPVVSSGGGVVSWNYSSIPVGQRDTNALLEIMVF